MMTSWSVPAKARLAAVSKARAVRLLMRPRACRSSAGTIDLNDFEHLAVLPSMSCTDRYVSVTWNGSGWFRVAWGAADQARSPSPKRVAYAGH